MPPAALDACPSFSHNHTADQLVLVVRYQPVHQGFPARFYFYAPTRSAGRKLRRVAPLGPSPPEHHRCFCYQSPGVATCRAARKVVRVDPQSPKPTNRGPAVPWLCRAPAQLGRPLQPARLRRWLHIYGIADFVTMRFLSFCFFIYGLLRSLSSAIPLSSPQSENVVNSLGLAARSAHHPGALAEPAVRREAGFEIRHGGVHEAAAPAALQGRSAGLPLRDAYQELHSEKRRLFPGAGAAAVPAPAPRDAESLIQSPTKSDSEIDPLALAPREAAPVPPVSHNTQASSASAPAAPIVSGNNAPLPTTYTPGWCGLHVRQTLWNTCLRFNHKEFVRPQKLSF